MKESRPDTPPSKSITGPTPDPRGFPTKLAGFAPEGELRAGARNWAYDSDLAAAFARYKKLQTKYNL